MNMLPGATNSCFFFFYMIKSISAGTPRMLCVASLLIWPREPPCWDCFLALDFGFVLRRHTLGSDCQLTEHIPELAAGWRPTRWSSQACAQATERCEVSAWASCAAGHNQSARACFCAPASHRRRRIKSKQPGEVWINRRSWQTDSSASADSRAVDDSSSVPFCGGESVY